MDKGKVSTGFANLHLHWDTSHVRFTPERDIKCEAMLAKGQNGHAPAIRSLHRRDFVSTEAR